MTNEEEHKRAALVYMLGSWFTVLVVCDSRRPGVAVPEKFRRASLALRWGYVTDPPIEDLQITEEGVSGGLLLDDTVQRVHIPWSAIYLMRPDGDDHVACWGGSIPADVRIGEKPVEPEKPRPSHLKLVE